jgi:hypothetical protein
MRQGDAGELISPTAFTKPQPLTTSRVKARTTAYARTDPAKAVGNATTSRGKPVKEMSKLVSTRPLLTKRVIDLPASREKLNIRRVLNHPLSKEFDGEQIC